MEKINKAKNFTKRWLKQSKEYRESFEHRMDNAFMTCNKCGTMTSNVEERDAHICNKEVA